MRKAEFQTQGCNVAHVEEKLRQFFFFFSSSSFPSCFFFFLKRGVGMGLGTDENARIEIVGSDNRREKLVQLMLRLLVHSTRCETHPVLHTQHSRRITAGSDSEARSR